MILIYASIGLVLIILVIVILYIRNKSLKSDVAAERDPKLKQAKLKEYAEKAKDIIDRDD